MRFYGLLPWQSDSEIIECVMASGRTIDLHNNATLKRMGIVFDTSVLLVFEFRIDETSFVSLEFQDVANLNMVDFGARDLPGSLDLEAVETLYSIAYREAGEFGIFEISTLFGDLSFEAASVSLSLTE